VQQAFDPVDRRALERLCQFLSTDAVGRSRLVGMTSLLSLSVERVHGRHIEGWRQVIVRIDGDDVSRADDNGGPDPWHVLVPVNRFVATDGSTTATIACCPSCGPDCYAVEARICREGDAVRWEWGRRGARWAAERRTTLFDAEAYDAEVARFGADYGWETAERRAGRLIIAGLALPSGLEGVRVRATDTGELEVWLEEPDEYQIFVRVPWDKERPDESAAVVRAVLAGPVTHWPAEWSSIQGGREDPPAYAGPSWSQWSPWPA
jgi:hypothetical protein